MSQDKEHTNTVLGEFRAAARRARRPVPPQPLQDRLRIADSLARLRRLAEGEKARLRVRHVGPLRTGEGAIARIIGPVIDARFPVGELPPVLGALRIVGPRED
ncbi:MAG: hypothetical protein JXA09_06990, partial [Anaerolineae bacterium]|nr:hypothetical protein [Anaerolineae bacterium]